MNVRKALFFTLTIVTGVVQIEASYLLQRDFIKFEQQLLTNTPTIDFNTSSSLPLSKPSITRSAETPKQWTFMVYMAADNDLRAFAANNIKQMATIGSNENINIAIHLDIRLNDNQKVTRRYYIDKDKIHHMNHDADTQRMDSGDPQTLISFCEWAIKNYPAQNYALILWNHGTGFLDPKYYKMINPAELFIFNPLINKFELDRSIEYLDLFNYADLDQRGICFDSSTGNYLTNQKLEFALHEICTNHIHGKFKLIGFDACLMSMLEVANFIKLYGETMVGSQEVELGAGWNYAHVLQPFATAGMVIDAHDFAAHIVHAYQLSYHKITDDFTQSALDLRKLPLLEQTIDLIGKLLLECLQKQQNSTVHDAIHASRNRKACTHFDVSSYLDLHHLLSNLQSHLPKIRLNSRSNLIQQLTNALTEGKKIIEEVVIANKCGKKYKNAKGISIYFPDHIQPSYLTSRFATENGWATFLRYYKG